MPLKKMNKPFLISCIMGLSCSLALAQLDDPQHMTSGNVFGSQPLDLSTTPSSTTPSLTRKQNNLWKSDEGEEKLAPEEKELDISENEGFIEPEVKFNPKYLEKEGKEKKIRPEFMQNQYFGDFKNNGKYVKIMCRDHEAVDGDRVRLLMNGKVIVENISLVSENQVFYIDLEKGFNKIEFEALNQGQSGPNTAAFKVIGEDGSIISSNEWNLTTGFKASLIIVKTE